MYLPNRKQNNNYKYLLTCIDVYSRFSFCVAIKTKINKLFEENGIPKNFTVHDGAEFQYKTFRQYCEVNNITLWVSDPEHYALLVWLLWAYVLIYF
jgi:hypothetical protein